MAKGSNNERIHSMLLELAETEKVKGDKMRSGAYYKAAASVKKCDEMITSGKQASKLEGVGKKIAEKIDELLTTGAPWRLEPPRAARRALHRAMPHAAPHAWQARSSDSSASARTRPPARCASCSASRASASRRLRS